MLLCTQDIDSTKVETAGNFSV